MGIKLGNLTLPDVVFDNEFGIGRVRSLIDTDLDGELNYWEADRPFVSFTLIGGLDFAWITRSDLIALRAMANTPMAVYTLNYEGVKRLVRFRNEDDPAIVAVPLVARPNQAATDYYNNLQIKLMDLGPVTVTTTSSTSTSTTTTFSTTSTMSTTSSSSMTTTTT